MSEEGLRSALDGWVEKSGRALELRTARLFRRSANVRLVNQAVPYEDVDSSKQRWGDVVAIYHWLADDCAVSMEATIECKSGRSEPWVAFYDDRHFVPEDSRYWWLSSGTWPAEYSKTVVDNWLAVGALTTDSVATHAVSALGNDSKNQAQDAVRQALSFARSRAKGPVTFAGDGESKKLGAVLPIVVTQAPLYTCELTHDGQVALEPVDGFDVWHHLTRTDRRRVYVRSEAGLSTMANGLARFRSRVAGN